MLKTGVNSLKTGPPQEKLINQIFFSFIQLTEHIVADGIKHHSLLVGQRRQGRYFQTLNFIRTLIPCVAFILAKPTNRDRQSAICQGIRREFKMRLAVKEVRETKKKDDGSLEVHSILLHRMVKPLLFFD